MASQSYPRSRFRLATASLGVVAALTVAACSSNASTGGSSPGASAPAEIVPPPPTTAPAALGVTQKLPTVPPKGKTVAWVVGGLPIQNYYLDEAAKATKALGWNMKTYVTDDLPGGIANAVQAKVDYIVVQGLTVATATTQLEAAHEAGIPVLNDGGTGSSDPSTDYYTMDGDSTVQVEPLVDWMINDSNGSAQAVLFEFSAVEFFQKAKEQTAGRFAAKCPKCKLDVVEISPEDLSTGKVPAKVVGYLQTHPDVKYVDFSFGDMYSGVYPQLKSTGLADKVTIVGVAPTQTVVKEMAAGADEVWSVSALGCLPWAVTDIFARMSVGAPFNEELSPTISHGVKTWVMAKQDEANKYADLTYGWPGPDGYDDMWKALWGV